MLLSTFNPKPLTSLEITGAIFIGTLGQNVFDVRPNFSYLAARVLETWSIVEAQSLSQYALIMGGPYSELSIAYMKSTSDTFRRDILKQHLFENYAGRERQLAGCLIELKAEYKKEKDKLVNWAWGFIGDSEDSVLLCDPKKRFGHPYNENDGFDKSNIFVYREEDFNILINAFDTLGRFFFELGKFRNTKDISRSQAAFEIISSDPVMAEKMKIWDRRYGLL